MPPLPRSMLPPRVQSCIAQSGTRIMIKKFDMQSQSHPNAFKRCLDILLWFQTHLPVEISTRSMSTHPIPAKIGR